MTVSSQPDLFERDYTASAAHFFNAVMQTTRRPSADELVREAASHIGPEAAWALPSIVADYAHASSVRGTDRDYCRSLLQRGDLIEALRRPHPPDLDAISTIDTLIRNSQIYRRSADFQEMIDFMGRFRKYSPYNNMLVRLQNPHCHFFATQRDWTLRFGRRPKDDARPMLILAPKHPVLLVYDLDQTIGKEVPNELLSFSEFEGEFRAVWLENAAANANAYRIDVQFKPLSSSSSGFASAAW